MTLDSMKDIHFKVCVVCATYNHEPYIEDAMRGFVSQETNFPFVSVIIDDASKDRTVDRIERFFRDEFNFRDTGVAYEQDLEYGKVMFAQHATNKNCYFAIILLNENHYSQKKSKKPYTLTWEATASYIAVCEGDDYWIDSRKLQKEVDVLDSDASLMGVVTDSVIVDKDGRPIPDRDLKIYPEDKPGRYNLHDFFLNSPSYPTATVVFRNINRDEILAKMAHTYSKYLGDWTLWAILHSYGDFYYINETTSAYRMNPTSLTHTVDRVGRAKASFTICKSLQEVLPEEYSQYLKKDAWMYLAVAHACRKEKKYCSMAAYFAWCLIRYPRYTIKRMIQLIRSK